MATIRISTFPPLQFFKFHVPGQTYGIWQKRTKWIHHLYTWLKMWMTFILTICVLRVLMPRSSFIFWVRVWVISFVVTTILPEYGLSPLDVTVFTCIRYFSPAWRPPNVLLWLWEVTYSCKKQYDLTKVKKKKNLGKNFRIISFFNYKNVMYRGPLIVRFLGPRKKTY